MLCRYKLRDYCIIDRIGLVPMRPFFKNWQIKDSVLSGYISKIGGNKRLSYFLWIPQKLAVTGLCTIWRWLKLEKGSRFMVPLKTYIIQIVFSTVIFSDHSITFEMPWTLTRNLRFYNRRMQPDLQLHQ